MKPIKIHIPKDTESESRYVFTILLEDVLGCKIEFETRNTPDYTISQGKRSIEIKSEFFKEGTSDKLYCADNIPSETSTNYLNIEGVSFIYETLYGKPEVELSKSNSVIHFDIIGSSFFMLTRWEEGISNQLDYLGRYNAENALSVRQGFYQRPILNEYAEVLYSIIKYMGFNVNERKYKYESVVTFDIDQIRKWFSFKQLLISIKDNVLAGKINYCFKDIASYFQSRTEVEKDPYCNFHYIIDSLKKHDIGNAIFYFKALKSESKYDRNKYDLDSREIQDAFEVIRTNAFEIGIHPGFLTFDTPDLIGEEVEALSKHAKQKINFVRQHYLKFKTPDTWRHQSSNDLTEDSTMIYPHSAGFRNGICQSFQVYDFEKRSVMNIIERPLIFMETSYLSNRSGLIEDLTRVSDQVKKYGGVNTVLWHNSNLEYPRDRVLYNEVLKIISSI